MMTRRLRQRAHGAGSSTRQYGPRHYGPRHYGSRRVFL